MIEPKHPVTLAAEAKKAVDQHLDTLRGLANKENNIAAVTKEAGLLNAWSARETTAGTLMAANTVTIELDSLNIKMGTVATNVQKTINIATENLSHRADTLNDNLLKLSAQIDAFTIKADRSSNWLIRATYVLAVAAIVAALIGAYATLTVAPQIITVGKP